MQRLAVTDRYRAIALRALPTRPLVLSAIPDLHFENWSMASSNRQCKVEGLDAYGKIRIVQSDSAWLQGGVTCGSKWNFRSSSGKEK